MVKSTSTTIRPRARERRTRKVVEMAANETTPKRTGKGADIKQLGQTKTSQYGYDSLAKRVGPSGVTDEKTP